MVHFILHIHSVYLHCLSYAGVWVCVLYDGCHISSVWSPQFACKLKSWFAICLCICRRTLLNSIERSFQFSICQNALASACGNVVHSRVVGAYSFDQWTLSDDSCAAHQWAVLQRRTMQYAFPLQSYKTCVFLRCHTHSNVGDSDNIAQFLLIYERRVQHNDFSSTPKYKVSLQFCVTPFPRYILVSLCTDVMKRIKRLLNSPVSCQWK